MPVPVSVSLLHACAPVCTVVCSRFFAALLPTAYFIIYSDWLIFLQDTSVAVFRASIVWFFTCKAVQRTYHVHTHITQHYTHMPVCLASAIVPVVALFFRFI